MPDRAPAHDHVPRRRADRADEGAHVIRAVEDHALRRQPVDVRRLQRRLRIVELEIERRLVVHEDEEDVRSAGRPPLRCVRREPSGQYGQEQEQPRMNAWLDRRGLFGW